MTITLLPICITTASFPHYTISKLRKPIEMGEEDFWDEYIDQARLCVCDGLIIKAYGFAYDGWRIIKMYKCTCVICNKDFEIEEPYDVCSMACEAIRWNRDRGLSSDEKGYIPKRDDIKVKPICIR